MELCQQFCQIFLSILRGFFNGSCAPYKGWHLFNTWTPKLYGQPHQQHRSPLIYYFPPVWPKGQTKSGLLFQFWAIISNLGSRFSPVVFLVHLFLSLCLFPPPIPRKFQNRRSILTKCNGGIEVWQELSTYKFHENRQQSRGREGGPINSLIEGKTSAWAQPLLQPGNPHERETLESSHH